MLLPRLGIHDLARDGIPPEGLLLPLLLALGAVLGPLPPPLLLRTLALGRRGLTLRNILLRALAYPHVLSDIADLLRELHLLPVTLKLELDDGVLRHAVAFCEGAERHARRGVLSGRHGHLGNPLLQLSFPKLLHAAGEDGVPALPVGRALAQVLLPLVNVHNFAGRRVLPLGFGLRGVTFNILDVGLSLGGEVGGLLGDLLL
mmetsp:Transcript_7969/g.15886  ORF Transcript_7969/g.15886 Transcript_7969/m.15886 type:complete len:203 (+) Transcript_7969:342-950(+)